VGDDEARALRSHAFIASWISTSYGCPPNCRLVEDQDRRVGEEGASDREQLLLTGADVVALLVDELS